MYKDKTKVQKSNFDAACPAANQNGEEFHRTMATSQLHESADDLSPETRELHRALASLIEEIEAVDWYAQRVDATNDEELQRVLAHNRDEEKEHACMTLEWIRRHDPVFDRLLRRFLFRDDSIVESEHGTKEPTLRIGSLRDQEERRA